MDTNQSTVNVITALRQILEATRSEYEASGGRRFGYFVPGGWAGDVLYRHLADEQGRLVAELKPCYECGDTEKHQVCTRCHAPVVSRFAEDGTEL